MADPTLLNIQAFQPYDGGDGKTFTANETSGSTAYRIPGLAGGTDDNNRKRVLISNEGDVAVFVRMGPSSVQASTDSLKILPDCAYLLTPPDVNPSGVWIAACTATGAGSVEINVVAGQGT
jgi:hypothetical protein